VPIVLSLITVVFTWQQNERQQQVEARRAESERELAEQRAQDEALQAYFDQMSQLILDKKLHKAEEGDPVYTLAQARTSTLISRLDAERNRSVTRFLTDSQLTQQEEGGKTLLRAVEVEGAALRRAYLPTALMDDADLSGANLREAILMGTILYNADMRGANLRGAYLWRANLRGASLDNANLRGANLVQADLGASNLREYAGLSDANLSHADLRNAEGVTKEQLGEAKSLEGAIMPDGQILKSDDNPDRPTFQEWLKSRGRGEDGENSGRS
jgi:uncharacterized protein YjbI with pentapeptide repeats